MKKFINFFSLFTSFSTLICCALPALLVTLGMGAALAGFLSKYPQLIWISENKLPIFIIGAILLTIGGILQFKTVQKVCPIGELQETCEDTKDISKYVYIFSLTIYFIGLSFAYIIPRFM